MKFFLWHDYDYEEMGGVGFEEFDAKEVALARVETLIGAAQARHKSDVLGCFKLIEGRELKLVPKEIIKKVDAE